MSSKFPEYKTFNLSEINKEILSFWKENNIFEKSIKSGEKGKGSYVFYEGPPSANGIPGIHHVISRTIKDIFCRFKTMQGYTVERKAGWDTHGLPVELQVEKTLGITKEDIGTDKISVAEYNRLCRENVMKYTKEWEDLTEKMGYWVNMDDPYITYDNRYVETLWYLLKELYKKDLLYKGYTIQPYSPAAGTGLSTHELNQPGCYRDVKDTTCVAQFEVLKNEKSAFLYENVETDLFFLAWTTTPWTLPSNMALAVGPEITYIKVQTYNQYTYQPITVILAKDLFANFFNKKYEEMGLEEFIPGDKKMPYKIIAEYKGKDLEGIGYNQLIDWINPKGDAFRVLLGDFVTTEDGTGIVHIAPTFGADDYRVGKQNGIDGLLVDTKNGAQSPLVDRQGRFIPIKHLADDFTRSNVNDSYAEFAGRFVKNEYDESLTEADNTVDVDISVMLKKDNKAFKIEKHVHNYPHCWRTDKPVLYYPLDSWFIKTTALKDKLIEHNNTINWKPESTGTGRFGKWLENLLDWNLSRSRYWGTPLPIWVSEDKTEQVCIGSVQELKNEIDRSVEAGFMSENPLKDYKEKDYNTANYESFDLHRPFVDDIILVSKSGKKMFREPDLIDVWFDSGAMPYAQQHYPFAIDEETFRKHYPADFIAEGVDQTRGWFFTLHAIAVMLFDSVAFKNIISNGLVLDKNGNKMSKRLGNAVDPFKAIEEHGSDPLRWYMMTNAQPWDNLKFDIAGVEETKRKFFSTLYNTYSFFSLYANIDGFSISEKEIPINERPEIDRWILSLLNSLIKETEEHYENYEPTKAGRAIQNFVTENLSNWYVRLNRKRYWGGEFDKDKISAYQTLFTCLDVVAKLMSPIAPFYSEKLFLDLHPELSDNKEASIHLGQFPKFNPELIDKGLEERMNIAQKVSSMILGLRRKVNIKVRQPLQKIMIPLLDESFEGKFEAVKNLIFTEVNVKEVEYLKDTTGILVKKIKPNFKTLGPKYGKMMKQIAGAINAFQQEDIASIEKEGSKSLDINGEEINISLEDVEILSEDIPGWLVSTEGSLTIALDVTVTEELKKEGIAREFVNRIQNLRKDNNFDVTDKINIQIQKHDAINEAVSTYENYIGSQTLAKSVTLVDNLSDNGAVNIPLDEEVSTYIKIDKI